MLETDLYGPLKTWFEAQGFEVRGEVLHCDLVAQKGDDFVVVELKLKPSLKLLYQATDRLQLTDDVYIALPAPTKKRKALKGLPKAASEPRASDYCSFRPQALAHASFRRCHRAKAPRRRSRRKALALTKEFSGRGQTDNLGGTASKKISHGLSGRCLAHRRLFRKPRDRFAKGARGKRLRHPSRPNLKRQSLWLV